MADPAYCSLDQVKAIAGIASESADTGRDAQITEIIKAISLDLDNQTGSWFDSRSKTFYVDPINPRATLVFMPAPIISITSITEAGTALTYNQWSKRGTYAIERAVGFWTTGKYDDGTNYKGAMKIVGVFGFAAVPTDVAKMVSIIAAIKSGVMKRSFIDQETRMEKTVTVTTIPKDIDEKIERLRWRDESGQSMEYV